jgi:hypothetical protein
MMEIQGIKTNEPALVATELQEKLAWSLTRRRYMAATATSAPLRWAGRRERLPHTWTGESACPTFMNADGGAEDPLITSC